MNNTHLRGQRFAWVVLALVLTGLGLWTLHEFLTALVWAAILAIAIWPLYGRALNRWPPGPHNILMPGIFTLAVALVFVLPIVLGGIQAGRETRSVLAWIDTARHDGIPMPEALTHLPLGAEQAATWWKENLADPGAAAELLRTVNRSDAVHTSRQVAAAILHGVVIFGFSLLTLFFLLKDEKTLSAQLRRASARAFGPGGERVGQQIIASVHGTVDGLVLVGLAEGVLLGIIYAVVGVPHPTLLGAATAIGAMVPMGAPLAFGVAALLALSQGSTVGAIVIVVAGAAISFVADHAIRPVLIGGATKLPFVWVLLGILGGVTTWGLIGLFLGPAIMAALILLWREWAA